LQLPGTTFFATLEQPVAPPPDLAFVAAYPVNVPVADAHPHEANLQFAEQYTTAHLTTKQDPTARAARRPAPPLSHLPQLLAPLALGRTSTLSWPCYSASAWSSAAAESAAQFYVLAHHLLGGRGKFAEARIAIAEYMEENAEDLFCRVR
jgi:hypothetical protein